MFQIVRTLKSLLRNDIKFIKTLINIDDKYIQVNTKLPNIILINIQKPDNVLSLKITIYAL